MARRNKPQSKPNPPQVQPAEKPGTVTLLLKSEPVPGEILDTVQDIYGQELGKRYTVIGLKRLAQRVMIETADGERHEFDFLLPTPITDLETYDAFGDLTDS